MWKNHSCQLVIYAPNFNFFWVNLYKFKNLKKIIQIPGAPLPIGPYSQAILSNDTLYVSGQIPMDPITGEIVDSSISKSTERVMENIKALINAASLKMDDIVKCNIFLIDMDDFQAVNSVYSTYFKDFPPARETVEVAKLPKGVSIEISCIAIK